MKYLIGWLRGQYTMRILDWTAIKCPIDYLLASWNISQSPLSK